MIVKKLRIGSTGLTITISKRIIEMIRSNMLYRFLIMPARRFLFYLKDSVKNRVGKTSRVDELRHNLQVIMSEGTAEQKAILHRISEIDWYHSIDLGNGVVTPGYYDHRPLLPLYHLPESVKDMRVLDVATNDGFWAFEFEKRGAAEVIAIDVKTLMDIDLPSRIRTSPPKEILNKEAGPGFNIAKDILGSKVQRKILSVYDLSPEKLGMFDFVFCSDLLLHLMNPMKALENIRSVVSGTAYIVDIIDPELGQDDANTVVRYLGAKKKCTWWLFSIGSLKQMIMDAGFGKVELISKFKFDILSEKKKFWHAVFKAYP
ncbi:MAG: methyltransferase domain-containing protein [Promethearchaeota archaeon]|jgi:tRNA (mo5U34)-methyltransferase